MFYAKLCVNHFCICGAIANLWRPPIWKWQICPQIAFSQKWATATRVAVPNLCTQCRHYTESEHRLGGQLVSLCKVLVIKRYNKNGPENCHNSSTEGPPDKLIYGFTPQNNYIHSRAVSSRGGGAESPKENC